MRFFIVFIIFFLAIHQVFAANEKSAVPTYKVSIDAKLYSHFIDRGLSISDKNPALNASFLFNLGPQFRFGFWGSNISNVTTSDDNFWFKFLADIKIDFNQYSSLLIYLNDDHFYKSSIRNGQSLGLKYNYELYSMHLEWMNNYQGTHVDSEYINIGKLFALKSSLRAGASVGYTIQNSQGYSNYFNLKALGIYDFNKNELLEAGATLVSDENQFNGRGEAALYLAFALTY